MEAGLTFNRLHLKLGNIPISRWFFIARRTVITPSPGLPVLIFIGRLVVLFSHKIAGGIAKKLTLPGISYTKKQGHEYWKEVDYSTRSKTSLWTADKAAASHDTIRADHWKKTLISPVNEND
jgi:hypothetical protein